MSTPRLAVGLAALVLALPACTGDRRAASAATPTPVQKRPVAAAPVVQATGAIEAVTEHEGTVLTELALGSAQGLEIGSLLRVYGTVGEQQAFKGMLQVTELIGTGRALARTIGLTDRTAPILVGDTARVADLGAAYADFRRDLARERAVVTGADQQQDAAFISLREHYQNELALAAGRFAEQRETDRAQHDQEISELAAAHIAELDRQRAEHDAAMAALRAAMVEEARTAVAADQTQRSERIQALQAEITALTANADRLGAELVMTRQAAIDLQRDLTKQAERHQREIRAEVETRQILQSHVERLDQGNANATPARTILTLDPQRGETVLARLERSLTELAQAQARIAALEQELATAQENSATTAAALHEATTRISTLESAAQRSGTATERLLAIEHELTTTREQLARHELARLEAERLLFDITARLLAAEDAVAIDALRERLRQHIADLQTAPGGKAP